MRITREYVKSYLEQYGVRKKEYKNKLEHLTTLKEHLNSFERNNSEVKTFNIESKQDRLIPLITDLENELKEDDEKLSKMFKERNKLIGMLDIEYSCFLDLRYLLCMQIKDIAKAYDVSLSTAMLRINKGIDELAEILKNKQAKKVQWYNIHII